MRKRSMLMSFLLCMGAWSGVSISPAAAQTGETFTDPATGTIYQRQMRTVQKRVSEVQMQPRTVTISRPETVVEAEPVSRTYFTPVVRYDWQPRWHGVWNPFAPDTLAYHYVPQTQWEARTETYNQLRTATRWVPESVVVNEPRPVTTVREEQVEDWVAIGRAAPTSRAPEGTAPSTGPTTQVASVPSDALRPIHRPTAYAPARPIMTGAMPATVLDPYSIRTYAGGTILR